MAPAIRYLNQTAPFWDFIASLEEDQANNNHANAPCEANKKERADNTWSEGWGAFPRGPFPHRGRPGAPPPADGTTDPEEGSSRPKDPPSTDDKPGKEHRQSHSHGHSHGAPGARGGPCEGKGRGGGWGGRSRFHPYAAGPFASFADIFHNQVFGGPESSSSRSENNSQDFHPDVDVFDTAESFIVHVSLPGAKKEDVGVSWDAEKSEIGIAGVVHRPGDEEFLKTLALDERRVGAFERKVRLGSSKSSSSRANPAGIDVDGITARLEDGILTVEVPKLDAGYVEIKKVDIE